MGYIIFILIMSVYIRRFLPAEGFLIDDRIRELTCFGNSEERVLFAPDDEQIKNRVKVKKEPIQVRTDEKYAGNIQPEEGVDLTDINAKENKEVDTSYLYSNFDDSDESLEEVVNKGLKL